jgi:hypothetical protein
MVGNPVVTCLRIASGVKDITVLGSWFRRGCLL